MGASNGWVSKFPFSMSEFSVAIWHINIISRQIVPHDSGAVHFVDFYVDQADSKCKRKYETHYT